MTDPIADMLTRIRNAALVKKTEIVLPFSKLKHEIAKILEKESWVEKAELMKLENSNFNELRIVLKYNEDGTPFITSLKRLSKPGRRVYVDKDNLPRVLNDFGIAILSTSRGLMTNKQARKDKIGGEVLCEIY